MQELASSDLYTDKEKAAIAKGMIEMVKTCLKENEDALNQLFYGKKTNENQSDKDVAEESSE